MAAHATRLKCPFFSKDGKAYQIWFQQDGWAGGVTTISGRGSPVSIEWGRRGIDIFTPIRGSHSAIALWRKTVTELDVLLDADTNEWLIIVVSGTSQAAIDAATFDEFWRGYLVLDNYEDSTIAIPDELDLEANDGVGELKNIPYTDASGSPEVAFTGRESFRVIARRCLDKLGYSLPFRMASRLYADGEPTSVDPWDKMECDNSIFYDDDGTAMSTYQVLQQLLYRMSAELFQRDGAWHFIAVELQDGTAYTVYKYTAGGAADGTTTQGVALDVDTLVTAETVLREPGRRGFIQPVGITSLRFNHGLIPSLIHGGTFSESFLRGGRGRVSTGELWSDFWTLSSGVGISDPIVRDASGARYTREYFGPRGFGRSSLGGYYTGNGVLFIPADFHGSSRVPDTVKGVVVTTMPFATQTGDPIAAGQRIVFTGTIKIPHNAGAGKGRFQTYWRIEIVGQDRILLTDGTWHDSTAESETDKAQTISPEGDNWGDQGVTLDQVRRFSFESEASPVAGDLFLKLYATSDVDGSDLDPEGVEWDDIEIQIIDEDGERLEANLTEAWTGLPDSVRPTIDLVMGPGPASFMPSAVTWGGVFFTDFVTDLIVAATELDELTTEAWVRFLNRFLERRHETYTRLDAEMGTPFTINSRNFALTYLRKDVRHQRDEFEIVRHIFDSAATISTQSSAENIHSFSQSSGSASALSGTVVDLGDLAGYISTQNPIALVDTEHEENDVVTVLTVDLVTVAGLFDEDEFVVVDRVTAKPFVFRMSADEADVTWDVEDPDNPGFGLTLDGPIAVGSGIYRSNAQLLDILYGVFEQLEITNDLLVDSPTFYVDSANNRVGMGTLVPDGTLHVHTGTAGAVTPVSDSDDLVVENSSHVGISLLSPDSVTSQIVFGSPSDARGASFTWQFFASLFTFGTNKSGAILELQSDNGQVNLTLSGIGGSRLGTFAGNISVDGGGILSSTGAISFGNENLTTTGFLQANTGGFGIARTEGTLHVHTGSAGAVTANTAGDDLVVENSTHGGISILCPDASTSTLIFGSLSDNKGAALEWIHNASRMTIATAKTGGFIEFQTDNFVPSLTLSGAAGSKLAEFFGDVEFSGAASSNGQSTNLKSATTELTGFTGASMTATNLIPAGSVVSGVTVRVTTLITGPAGFDVGDGTDVDRWGNSIVVAANTTTNGTDFTATDLQVYPAATNIVLTSDGVDFTAGAVRITVHYFDFTPAVS